MENEILDDDIIIRIPRKFYNGYIKDLVDAIEHKEIVSKSEITDKKFEELMQEIKAERGEIVKPLLDKIKKHIR